jgi:hypothetical protein
MKLRNSLNYMAELSKQLEEKRLKKEKSLGNPFWFVPDKDTEGHGLGFFRITPDLIEGYRKSSNGYDSYPHYIFEKDFIDKIYAEFHKTDTA